jgi:hypothetical protein
MPALGIPHECLGKVPGRRFVALARIGAPEPQTALVQNPCEDPIFQNGTRNRADVPSSRMPCETWQANQPQKMRGVLMNFKVMDCQFLVLPSKTRETKHETKCNKHITGIRVYYHIKQTARRPTLQ